VSAGLKTDITPEEAQSFFLVTYLRLGEIACILTPSVIRESSLGENGCGVQTSTPCG
jgi:hypothetical protein